MMGGHYSISRDVTKGRVIVTFDGPRTYPIDKFWEAFTEAVQFAKCARPHFDVLLDHSRATIMPPERTQKSEEMAIWCVENGLRKSANIVPSAVLRMQLQRVTKNEEPFGFFETQAEAEAWLDE